MQATTAKAMQIQPLVLAAGKGIRMNSSRPKVLQNLGGKSMLAHVLESCTNLAKAGRPLVVAGFGSEQIRARFGDSVNYVEQRQPLGTGHAVRVAIDGLGEEVIVLILYGDVPLVSPVTLQSVAANALDGRAGALSLLTVSLEDSTGYGRVLRNSQGDVVGIVEQKDASREQLAIKEVNTGIMAVQGKLLKPWVERLSNDNAQGEYYLTDIVAMAVEQSIAIKVTRPGSVDEVLGVNDRGQLARLEALYRDRQMALLMEAGVTLVDPKRVDVRGTLVTGRDVQIDVNVLFEGDVELGDDVVIEPNCVIKDSRIAGGARIRAFSHLEGAVVGARACIGPYARLREGSAIGDHARVGNFVETKNIRLGQGSKANHLTYLGDSRIGAGVNIGAGTITCNYDGKDKHQTRLEDDVFIGSNSALVAPVTVGKGATVAAGTVVTRDVEAKALAIARSQQRTVRNWARPGREATKD